MCPRECVRHVRRGLRFDLIVLSFEFGGGAEVMEDGINSVLSWKDGM